MRQINWRSLAPIGPYLSLAAAFAALCIYILQKQFNLGVQISLGFIVIGLAIFALLDPDRVRVMISGRQARYGSNVAILTIAIVGILVTLNLLVYKHSIRWDITQGSQHTLAPETLLALRQLPQPVTALAFFTSQADTSNARSLLEDYRVSSNNKFNFKFIDPNSDPVTAREAQVTQDGTIVLELGQLKEKITTISETEISNAIIRLSNPGQKTLYFLTGHGELAFIGTTDLTLSKAKVALENKGYTVKQLNLIIDHEIPADAKSIIIVGPQKPISADEEIILQAFLEKGNSLAIFEQPTLLTEYGDSVDPLNNYLSESWGITYGNDMVVDLSANYPSIAVANEYGSHLITSKLSGMVTVFPTARSVKLTSIDGINQTILVKTSSRSWAESNFEDLKNNKVTFDKNNDLNGPVTIAIAAENNSNKARIVVVGDSDFATDAYFLSYGNSDFFANAIDWTDKQENLINLTTKQATNRILVPPKAYTLGLIFIVTVILLPGLVVAGGIVVWARRKKQG